MFTEEDKKRYYLIANEVYKVVEYYKLDITNTKIWYNVYRATNGFLQGFNSVASLIQYLYDNHFAILDYQATSDCNGNIDYVSLKVIPDLTTTISNTVYDLLKQFGNKKVPEFKEQLDNAILNGHITFKQYNELCREVQ